VIQCLSVDTELPEDFEITLTKAMIKSGYTPSMVNVGVATKTRSGYAAFSSDRFAKAKKDGVVGNKRNQLVVEEWKSMTPEQKKEWTEIGKSQGVTSTKSSKSTPSSGKETGPRKRTSYNAYVKEQMAFLSPQGITGATAMKQIGVQWKGLLEADKEVYQTQADQWNTLSIDEQTGILDGEKQVRTDKKKQKQAVKTVEEAETVDEAEEDADEVEEDVEAEATEGDVDV
jgi:hypothetical protein